MTESWSYEEAKTLSDQLDTFTSLMKTVVSKLDGPALLDPVQT